jgi:hypothetical protein
VIVEIAAVVLATGSLFWIARRVVARALHSRGPDDVRAHLAAAGIRLVLAALLALGLGLRVAEHRVALVLAVGATYFAAAVLEGVLAFRNRKAGGYLTR